MPLDPLQDLIARTALNLPEAHTLALAGGAAMIAHGFVTRATQDVDLFTEIDDSEAVRVVEALRPALERAGLTTRDAERPPFDHRFVVVDSSSRECTAEVFADGGRLHPRVTLDIGPVLHPDDLAAAKDAGFTTATFLDALNAINRLTTEDWTEDGIDLASIDHLRSAFADWHRHLAAQSCE